MARYTQDTPAPSDENPFSSMMGAPEDYKTAPKQEPPVQGAGTSEENPFASHMAEPGSYTPKASVEQESGKLPNQWVDVRRGTEENPMSAGEFARGFTGNVLPSTGHAVAGVAHVMNPYNWGEVADGVKQLAFGLYSKEQGWQGVKQDTAQKAQDEAAVNAFMESYKDKYGKGWEGLKYALATDPASVGMDVATLASGGAGSAEKMATVVGDATAAGRFLSKTAENLNKVADYTNPVTPVTATAKAAYKTIGAPIVGKIFKTAGAPGTEPIWDASSNTFTKPVQDVINSHFEGRVDPSALHSIKDEITHEMSNVGINGDALNQALLKANKMEPTTSTVTGVRAPNEVLPGLEGVKRSNMAQAMQNAEDLAGGPMPDTPVLGDALEKAMEKSKNNYQSAYNTLDANADQLHPSVFNGLVPDLHAAFEAKTGTSLDPNKFSGYSGKQGLSSNQTKFPNTQRAIEILENDLAPVPSATPLSGGAQGPAMLPKITALGPITQKSINGVRKSLNELWADASDTDRRGIDAVKQALDQRIQGAYGTVTNPVSGRAPMVFDANGRPLSQQQALQTNNLINDANSKFAAHQSMFADTSNSANGLVARAAKQLKDSFAFDPATRAWAGQATPEMQQLAQGVLLKGLKDPNAAAAVYDNLAGKGGVFANSPQHVEMLNQMLRSSILNVKDASELPGNIENFLTKNKPLADKIFPKPEDQSKLRQISESVRLLKSGKMSPAQESSLARSIATGTMKLGLIGAGHAIAGDAGAFIAGLLSNKVGKTTLSPEAAMRQQSKGAPTLPLSSYVPTVPGIVPQVGNGLLQAGSISNENQQRGNRLMAQPRKSGGRVARMNAEQRAESLIRLADLAKKHVNKSTEQILTAPDETVVKALKIAQAHI